MPSTHISRRAALRSAAGLFGVLAGCGSPGEPSPTATTSGPPTGAVTDPPHVQLRNPEPGPVVFREGESTKTESDGHLWRHTIVADAETAGELRFAAVDGLDRARQFLDSTDFASETVYVEQREIAECFERELCWVRWSRTKIETDYARRYRDADVACDADAQDVVAALIRLPATVDPDRIHQYGSSSGTGRCHPPKERPRGET